MNKLRRFSTECLVITEQSFNTLPHYWRTDRRPETKLVLGIEPTVTTCTHTTHTHTPHWKQDKRIPRDQETPARLLITSKSKWNKLSFGNNQEEPDSHTTQSASPEKHGQSLRRGLQCHPELVRLSLSAVLHRLCLIILRLVFFRGYCSSDDTTIVWNTSVGTRCSVLQWTGSVIGWRLDVRIWLAGSRHVLCYWTECDLQWLR